MAISEASWSRAAAEGRFSVGVSPSVVEHLPLWPMAPFSPKSGSSPAAFRQPQSKGHLCRGRV